MERMTNNEINFLNDCFYLSFYSDKEYETCIKNFIDISGNTYSFRLTEFIDKLKSEQNTMGLIPIDLFYDNVCTTDVLKKIESSFKNGKKTGGYTRLFLEYLFDERFKTEFNKLVKERKPTFSNNYFSTQEYTGIFDYDMIGKYLEDIKELYKGSDTGYDFSSITGRRAVYSKKNNEKKKAESNNIKGWTEPLDNAFSMFKLYGQEQYSRILISLLGKYNGDGKSLVPEKMIEISSNVVFEDEEIKKTYPDEKTPSVLMSRVVELEYQKLQEELQRFFDDYIPSHLDRIFVLNSEKHKNETLLRELLVRDFKGILSNEWKLYKKLGCDDDSYEELSVRNPYTDYELQLIEEEFNNLAENGVIDVKGERIKAEDCILPEKIAYIMRNSAELISKPKWNRIFEKFKEYNPSSIDAVEEYEGKLERINDSEWKEKLEEKEALKCDEEFSTIESNFNNTLTDGDDKDVLLSYFKRTFVGENQFLSYLEEDLREFNDFDIVDFMKILKGSKGHPWERFWREYKRNSEIKLYTERKFFTRTMNQIEQKIREGK